MDNPCPVLVSHINHVVNFSKYAAFYRLREWSWIRLNKVSCSFKASWKEEMNSNKVLSCEMPRPTPSTPNKVNGELPVEHVNDPFRWTGIWPSLPPTLFYSHLRKGLAVLYRPLGLCQGDPQHQTLRSFRCKSHVPESSDLISCAH